MPSIRKKAQNNKIEVCLDRLFLALVEWAGSQTEEKNRTFGLFLQKEKVVTVHRREKREKKEGSG